MNKQRLLEIISVNPWLTKIGLVKLASSEISEGVDDPGDFIKELIGDLRAERRIKVTGRARGTRYAQLAAAAYEPPKITDKDRAAVLESVNEGSNLSRLVAAVTSIPVADVRKILTELDDAHKIERTGRQKGTKYWPVGGAPKSAAPAVVTDDGTKKKPPRTIKPSQRSKIQDPESDKIDAARAAMQDGLDHAKNVTLLDALGIAVPKVSPRDALLRTLANLPRRRITKRAPGDSNVYSLDELLNRASTTFGADRFQLSKLITVDRILGSMGDGADIGDTIIHAQSRYAYKKGHPGWSMYVWRPARDDEDRPPDSQPRRESQYGAWSNADHEAANSIRSGRRRKS